MPLTKKPKNMSRSEYANRSHVYFETANQDNTTFGDYLHNATKEFNNDVSSFGNEKIIRPMKKLKSEGVSYIKGEKIISEPEAEEPKTPISAFKKDLQTASDLYQNRVKASNMLTKEPDEQELILRNRNHEYALMFSQRVTSVWKDPRFKQPGDDTNKFMLKTEQVMATVTSAAILWLACPAIREALPKDREASREYHDQAIKQRILDKVESKNEKNQKLGRKLERQYENIKSQDRDGYAPFTADSAALAEIALNEDLYERLREPGADHEGVMHSYNTSINTLYTLAHNDGIEANDVAEASRRLIGEEIRRNPATASVYKGLSHGQYSPNVEETISYKTFDGEVRSGTRWTGEFSSVGGDVINEGRFEVRMPMSQAEHQDAIANSIKSRILAGTVTKQGMPRLFDNQVKAIHKGFLENAAAGSEYFRSTTKHDPSAKAAADNYDKFMDSMEEDGIDAETRNHIYADAFSQVVEDLGNDYPELANAWEKKYGGTYMKDFEEMTNGGNEAKQWDTAKAQSRAHDEAKAREEFKQRESSFASDLDGEVVASKVNINQEKPKRGFSKTQSAKRTSKNVRSATTMSSDKKKKDSYQDSGLGF